MIKMHPQWIAAHQRVLKEELVTAGLSEAPPVDIQIVVHNQLEYVKTCIESVRKYTKDYNIWVWNNASDKETTDWLEAQPDLHQYRSDYNEGFIRPNNLMVREGNSPYVVLLNSDTCVRDSRWIAAMTGMWKDNPMLGAVGYEGGLLDENGRGTPEAAWGNLIDYVQGWCMCIPRWVIGKTGLFDQDNLAFAYCEDADFCLRLKEKGYGIYALHVHFVEHVGQRTTKSLTGEMAEKQRRYFTENHDYMKRRWGPQLEKERAEILRINFTNSQSVS